MIPIFLAALLTLVQTAPVSPIAPTPPMPPSAPAPPAPPSPIGEEAIEASGFLGVVPADVTRDEVMRLALKEETGALVKEVIKDGPAAEAGLKKDDVITAVGRNPVESASQLRRIIRETPAGRTVVLTVVRERRLMEVPVTLDEPQFKVGPMESPGRVIIGRGPHDNAFRVQVERELEGSREEMERAREEIELSKEEMKEALEEADRSRKEIEIYLKGADGEFEHLDRIPSGAGHPFVWMEGGGDGDDYDFRFLEAGKPRLGVGLQELTPQLAEYFGLKDRDGVLVTSVSEGAPAAKAGIRAGDILLSVAGKPVEEAGDVREALSEVQEGPVDVKILRDKKELILKPILEKSEKRGVPREQRVRSGPAEENQGIRMGVKGGEPGGPSL